MFPHSLQPRFSVSKEGYPQSRMKAFYTTEHRAKINSVNRQACALQTVRVKRELCSSQATNSQTTNSVVSAI